MHHTHTTYIHKIGNTYLPITSIISRIGKHQLQLHDIRLAAAAAELLLQLLYLASRTTDNNVQPPISQHFYSSYPT